MTNPERSLVADLVALYADADRYGTEVDLDADTTAAMVLAEADILELDLMRLEAERVARAARKVRELVETWIARDIHTNGPVRLGDDGWYVGPETDTELIDPEGLASWVRSVGGERMIAKAFRLEPRLRVIQGMAADHGYDPDVVMGQFFTRRTDPEPKLRKSRARWVEGLEHGQRKPQ